jgi:hypothetical protein
MAKELFTLTGELQYTLKINQLHIEQQLGNHNQRLLEISQKAHKLKEEAAKAAAPQSPPAA